MKTLVAMLDADGCIYNTIYRYLLLHILNKFGKELFAPEVNAKDLVDKVISEIKDQVDNGFPILANPSDEENLLDEVILKYANKETLSAFINNDPEMNKAKLCITILNEFLSKLNILGEEEKRFRKELLFAANRPLFEAFKKKILEEKFDKFVIASGSNRQSPRLDQFNSQENGTGLFREDLALLKEKFHEELSPCNVLCSLDNFNLYDDVFDKKDSFFDKTKFTLHYANLHHHAIENKVGELEADSVSTTKKNEVTVVSVDDKEETIQHVLLSFLCANQHFIPGLDLEFWPYFGTEIKQKRIFIDLNDNNFRKILKENQKKEETHSKKMEVEINSDNDFEDEDAESLVFILKGKGGSDPLFVKNVINMTNICSYNDGLWERNIDVAGILQSDLVKLQTIKKHLSIEEPLDVKTLSPNWLIMFKNIMPSPNTKPIQDYLLRKSY